MVVARAESQMGNPYNLFNANCEHFADWAARGIKETKQVRTAVGIVRGSGLMGGLVSSRNYGGAPRGLQKLSWDTV